MLAHALVMKDIEPVSSKARAGRRRFRRVRVDLPGKLFIPPVARKIPARLSIFRPAGAWSSAMSRSHRKPVVLYIDGFGRFEGTVARRDGISFGVNFVCTAVKRERTAEQLTVFLNKGLVGEFAAAPPRAFQPQGLCPLHPRRRQHRAMRGDGYFGERRLAQDRCASGDRRIRAHRPDGRPCRAPSRAKASASNSSARSPRLARRRLQGRSTPFTDRSARLFDPQFLASCGARASPRRAGGRGADRP